MTATATTPTTGTIVQIIGPVLDIEFPPEQLPEIYNALTVEDSSGPVPVRLTAEVHGACVGAGVELAAFAARVSAAPGTTFRLPEVAMGLVPGSGGTWSVSRRIGAQRTNWLALTGATIDVTLAVRWGLVDEVSDGSLAG